MALKGNQKKLDKNNNNRIDAQDFKILKAEKAKGRGQGLQDEKMKPGKVMKAKRGKAVQGTTAKSSIGKTFGYQKVFETGADRSTPKNLRGVSTIIGVKPNPKKSVAKSKRKTFKSMEEMRKAKGFKPGETASEFNKRRMALASAKEAAKATRIGKIVLPIAAAGVAASQYLKSKMKKKDKKMGGGMMKVPGYSSGTTNTVTIKDGRIALTDPRTPRAAQQRRMGRKKPSPGPLGRAGRGVAKPQPRRAGIPSLPGKKKKETLGQAQYKTFRSELDTQFKKGQRLQKSYEGASPTIKADMEKRFKDSYKPGEMVSSSRRDTAKTFMRVGGSVTVKTKLGRNKPTKMY